MGRTTLCSSLTSSDLPGPAPALSDPTAGEDRLQMLRSWEDGGGGQCSRTFSAPCRVVHGREERDTRLVSKIPWQHLVILILSGIEHIFIS